MHTSAPAPATLATIASDALDVVVYRNLVEIQKSYPTGHMTGPDVARLALANNMKLGRHFGLNGELAPLLLRYHHDPTALMHALTCCPERLELLRTLSPEWLRTRFSGKKLLNCLHLGGQLALLPREWILQVFPGDDDRVAALLSGGHLDADAAADTTEWLAANIKQGISLMDALVKSGRLEHVTIEWLSTHYSSFENLADSMMANNVDLDTTWLLHTYRTYYATPYLPAVDLGLTLIRWHGDCLWRDVRPVYDFRMLFRILRGVDIGLMLQLVSTNMSLSGIIESLQAAGGEDVREFLFGSLVANGWAGDADTRALADAVADKHVFV